MPAFLIHHTLAAWVVLISGTLMLLYLGVRYDMRSFSEPPKKLQGLPDWETHVSTNVWKWFHRNDAAPGKRRLPYI